MLLLLLLKYAGCQVSGLVGRSNLLQRQPAAGVGIS